MKNKPLYFIVLGGIFLVSLAAYSYNNTTTHAALTEEAVSFSNLLFPDRQIPSEYREALIEGAILEDAEPRYINHFFDPTTGKGWLMDNAGDQPFLFKLATKLGVSTIAPLSAKDWATNERTQEQYASYEGNRTYQRAIREYARGNKKEAFKTLGFVLHLIQDMTVPDHTRQDTHTGIFGDEKSPYEVYADQYQRGGINVAASYIRQNEKLIEFQSLNEYFDHLAKYSNGYFLSADTIFKDYSFPKADVWRGVSDFENIGYVKNNNDLIPVVIDNLKTNQLTINDPRILSSYWERLSKKAILGSAGVIQLFLKEAQEAERNYDQTRLQKMTTGVSEATSYIYFAAAGPQFSPWGVINKVVNVEKTYAEMKFAAEVVGDLAVRTALSVGRFVSNTVSQATAYVGNIFQKIPDLWARDGGQLAAGSILPIMERASDQTADAPVTFSISGPSDDRNEAVVVVVEAPKIIVATQSPVLTSPAPVAQAISLIDTFAVINDPIILPAQMGFSDGFIPTFGGLSGGGTETQTQESTSELNTSEDPVVQDPSSAEQNEDPENNDPPLQGDIQEEPPAVPPEEEIVPEPPQDTTAPVPTLYIAGYQFSSRNITVEYGVSEEVSDFLAHEIQYRIGSGGAWTDIIQSVPSVDVATISGSFVLQAQDHSTIYFHIRSKDILQNTSEWVDATAFQDASPVIINEVAWMGSPESQYDEWFELYNKTNLPIDLAEGWHMQSRYVNINFAQQESNSAPIPNTVLAPYGYYLVERKTASKEAPSLPAVDWFGAFGSGLVNAGSSPSDFLTLLLPSGGAADSVGAWYAGKNDPKKTMERVSEFSDTDIRENWMDYQGNEGYSTPRAENSVHGRFIAKVGRVVADETWSHTEIPYVVFGQMQVEAGVALTMNAGITVKFAGAKYHSWMRYSPKRSGLDVYGLLRVDGTQNQKVLFTALEDDTDGRDTDSDSGAGAPTIGSFSGISLYNTTASTSINGLEMRYAGNYNFPQRPMIDIQGGTVDIYDSSFSHAAYGVIGVQAAALTVERSAFSTVSEDAVAGNNRVYGIALSVDSSLTASSNTFRGSYEGISSISNICSSLSDNLFEGITYPITITNAIPTLSGNRFTDNTFNAVRLAAEVTKTCGEQTAHTTFIINGQLNVGSGASLFVGPGSVFKFGPDTNSIMMVLGTLAVRGTSEEPAVFTSVHDAEYGGVTYMGAGGVQEPAPGDWTGIRISGAPASVDHAIFRYGGRIYSGIEHYESSILEINNATASIFASSIKNSMYIGLRALNAQVVLDGVDFQNNNFSTYYSSGRGLSVGSSIVSIMGSLFRDNSVGIRVDDATSVVTVDDVTKSNSTDISSPAELLLSLPI
jgi:hypothetical protein